MGSDNTVTFARFVEEQVDKQDTYAPFFNCGGFARTVYIKEKKNEREPIN